MMLVGMGVIVKVWFLGVVFGSVSLILFLAALIKKSKMLFIFSLISIVIAAGSVLINYLDLKHQREEFEKIPYTEISGNSVTILNYGTGSMGSYSLCAIAEEDENGNIIVMSHDYNYRTSKPYNYTLNSTYDSKLIITDKPLYYDYNRSTKKFGYTFTAPKAGTSYVCIVEMDCASVAYADVYKIVADDSRIINVEKTEHIERNKNIREELTERFLFDPELLE